jgi:hypothetical protein
MCRHPTFPNKLASPLTSSLPTASPSRGASVSPFPTAGASTASAAPASAYIVGTITHFWGLVWGIPTLAYTKLPNGDNQPLATHMVKGLVFSNILRVFKAPIDWLVRVVVMDLLSSNSRTAICPSPIPSVTGTDPRRRYFHYVLQNSSTTNKTMFMTLCDDMTHRTSRWYLAKEWTRQLVKKHGVQTDRRPKAIGRRLGITK